MYYRIDDRPELAAEEGTYAGYFLLAPCEPASAETGGDKGAGRKAEADYFVRAINNHLKNCKAYPDDGPSDNEQRLAEQRKACVAELKVIAEKFVRTSDGLEAIFQTGKCVGEFFDSVDRIISPKNIVRVIPDGNNRNLAWDLEFDSAIIAKLSADQQRLATDISYALTVVKLVLKPIEPGYVKRLLIDSRIIRNLDEDEAVVNDRRERRADYVRKLERIARAALQEEKAGFAVLSLQSFKDEVVAREADRIKKQYVTSLGARAARWASLFIGLIGIIFIVFWLGYWKNKYSLFAASYCLLAVGACAGTWLSFSLRRVTLGFTDLALLEEDRMSPTSRILFVIGLTWTIGMFLQSGLIPLKINDIAINLQPAATTGSSTYTQMVLVPLLVGTLCGIAERALAGVVSKRADSFVSTLGAKVSEERKP